MDMANPTRWGIMAAGKISGDFVTCLRSSPNHQTVAVAARSLDSAKTFAEKHGIPKAYGSYVELVQDPEVEIIYIGTLISSHIECGEMALQHGKHVLMEKSFSMTAKGAEKLIQLAKSKNLFLMEAVWARFNPIYKLIKQRIAEGVIGEVYHVNANFGLDLMHEERLIRKSLGGGCMLDLGIYCLNVISWVYGDEEPMEVKAAGHVSNEGIDECVSVALKYSNGRIATASSHLKVKLHNECTIVGTKGIIHIQEPFWCPTKVMINDQAVEVSPPDIKGDFNFVNSSFLLLEADHVQECLLNGLTESPILPPKVTLTLRKTTDHILRQVGVFFEE